MAVLGSLALPHVAHAVSKPKLVLRRLLRIKSGGSIAVKLGKPNRVGDLIVAYLLWNGSGSASISDSRGNAYQSAVGPTPGG